MENSNSLSININESGTDTNEKHLDTDITEYTMDKKLDIIETDEMQRIKYILQRLRRNCVYFSIYHNRRYHFYKNLLFCIFRIPLIIFSGLNSFFAVGLQNYLQQSEISLLNALLSLFCGVLTSVEILLRLKERSEVEMNTHKNFYELSIIIFKYLKMHPDKRTPSETEFLESVYDKYTTYIKEANTFNVYRRNFLDQLEYITNDEKEKLENHVNIFSDKSRKSAFLSSCCY